MNSVMQRNIVNRGAHHQNPECARAQAFFFVTEVKRRGNQDA
jgi:hypothetical protein